MTINKKNSGPPKGVSYKTQLYIYLIRNEYTGYTKIGISKDPKSRLSTLQIGCAYELTLVKSYKTDFAFKIENILHRHFKQVNLKGEWFNLFIEDFDTIDSIIKTSEENLKFLNENKDEKSDRL